MQDQMKILENWVGKTVNQKFLCFDEYAKKNLLR